VKRKLIVAIFIFLAFVIPPIPAQADMFGGDVVVLGQILANAIQQLAQLRALLNNGQDTLGLIQSINEGINSILALHRTAFPNADPGIYKDWEKLQDALLKLQALYGSVPLSPEAKIQTDTDQSVAEAITLNNSIYDYTKDIDTIGEEIKDLSQTVSPKGAQKLTAQTLGVMLHVLNQSLRAQATALKLQAQNTAVMNHRDKELTRQVLGVSDTLKAEADQNPPRFEIPRF
jgi:hypothetical protein